MPWTASRISGVLPAIMTASIDVVSGSLTHARAALTAWMVDVAPGSAIRAIPLTVAIASTIVTPSPPAVCSTCWGMISSEIGIVLKDGGAAWGVVSDIVGTSWRTVPILLCLLRRRSEEAILLRLGSALG